LNGKLLRLAAPEDGSRYSLLIRSYIVQRQNADLSQEQRLGPAGNG
jgi:hypothetical protein